MSGVASIQDHDRRRRNVRIDLSATEADPTAPDQVRQSDLVSDGTALGNHERRPSPARVAERRAFRKWGRLRGVAVFTQAVRKTSDNLERPVAAPEHLCRDDTAE